MAESVCHAPLFFSVTLETFFNFVSDIKFRFSQKTIFHKSFNSVSVMKTFPLTTLTLPSTVIINQKTHNVTH